MAIKYALIENLLTADPNNYYARIQITGRAGKEELVDRMLSMGSTVTRPDLLAAFALLEGAALALVHEGYRVDIAGIVDIYPRLQGVFNGPADGFDAARHTLGVTANPSSAFVSRVRRTASVAKIEATRSIPSPLDLRDAATATSNGTLTPGNIATLGGSRLKYNTATGDEGVYFIANTGGLETKAATVSMNKPGQIVFLIPASLVSGDYRLQVRARMHNSGTIRTGTLDAVLSVP